MMNTNKRIERIIKRAIDYNNGLLTPSAFALLEEIDGENEASLQISSIKRNKIIKAIHEILAQDDENFFKPEPEPQTPAFSMTLDEYEALSLYDQNKVYTEHPEEVKKLLHPVVTIQVTKEMYNKMNISEQSRYYKEMPDQVKALLDGIIPYCEIEVTK